MQLQNDLDIIQYVVHVARMLLLILELDHYNY